VKTIAAVAFFVLLFLAFVAQAAEEPVSFAGTWMLDQAKSDPFPRSQTGNAMIGDLGGGADGMDAGGTGGMGGGGMGRGGGGRSRTAGGMPGDTGSGMPEGGSPGRGMGRGQGPSALLPFVIEQNGNEVRFITKTVNRNGQEMPSIEAFTCDGKQHEDMVQLPGSPDKLKRKTKATLKKNKLVVEQVTDYPGMQVLFKRTYTLSQDGKTMTQETNTANTTMSTIQKRVYNRQ
jgi:hypothetical protein